MLKNKKKSILNNRLAVCLGISFLAGLLTILASYSSFVQNFELKMLNTLFRLRGEEQGAPAVLVADIDEQMIQRLGYPVPRLYLALLLQVMQNAGAKTVGFDMFFDMKSARPEQDATLAEKAGDFGKTRFPATFQLQEENKDALPVDADHATIIRPYGWSIRAGVKSPKYTFPRAGGEVGFPFDQLLDSLENLCQVNVIPDLDGYHRRVPMFVEYNGLLYPNLGLQVAMDYLGIGPADLHLETKHLVLMSKTGPIRIPLDRQGNLLINFSGTDEVFETNSILKILQENNKKSDIFKGFKDRAVVVGQSSTVVGDLGPTPFRISTPLHFLHANVASNIINRDFLAQAPAWQRMALMVLLCLLTGLVLARFKTKFAIPLVVIMLGLYGGAVYALFTRGAWYDLAIPALGVILTYFSCFLWIYLVVQKDERFVKDVFGKYVSDEVLSLMKEKDLAAAGERKELTLLFSDVKGFSRISDEVRLELLVLQLKEYFDEMTRIIFKYDGYLDKFMGDGIMAFFNDPKPRPDHVLCGVKAAWEMQESLKVMREKWGVEGKVQLHIRIGMNTGIATVGNLGSSQKFTYTAFGSTVNVASRMESSGVPDGVQVTDAVYEATKDHFEYIDAGEIIVKNIVKPVKIYHVKGPLHA
jgi:adenylate cyclase